MRNLLRLVIVVATLFLSLSTPARPIDLSQPNQGPIGRQLQYLVEGASPFDLNAAREAYAAGRFIASQDAVLNFGIGAHPVWLRLDVVNAQATAIVQRLSLETSWLDQIAVFFLQDGKLQASERLGDRLPYDRRSIEDRFFAVEYAFPPGATAVYIRVATPDPMVLPIYLTGIEQTNDRHMLEVYSYGFLYGFIFALLTYNLMLFFSLRNSRYLYYSLYLASFLLMNISYTGHGYRWLWPASPVWQQWSNPVLMILFAISGLLFASRFLDIRRAFPRLFLGVMGTCAGFGLLETLSVVAGNQVSALLVAFAFIFVFSFGMIFLGALSLHAGNRSAIYFLLASITHSVCSLITAMVVWGIIPYSIIAYRAVDIGMIIDAALLAMALADQFRISQEAKIQAERLARVDPLTRVNNRRAFQELVRPLWSTGQRRQKDSAVILVDIDRFKSINDTCGHNYGDQVLIKFANSLKKNAREGDILARWGGEEFILFLPETSLEEAVAMAERLRHETSTIALDAACQVRPLTASFGVAQSNHQLTRVEDLIARADQRLYLAKQRGRDQVCSEDEGVQ